MRLELNAQGTPAVLGEAFLIESALHNLLQNAIDFSPSGGLIRLHVAPESAGTHVALTVEDEGPGIPDYALQRVFDRFYSLQRPDTGRKSSGLGLCFVREAAVLHGGAIAITNRAGGRGACASLRLPICQA